MPLQANGPVKSICQWWQVSQEQRFQTVKDLTVKRKQREQSLITASLCLMSGKSKLCKSLMYNGKMSMSTYNLFQLQSEPHTLIFIVQVIADHGITIIELTDWESGLQFRSDSSDNFFSLILNSISYKYVSKIHSHITGMCTLFMLQL